METPSPEQRVKAYIENMRQALAQAHSLEEQLSPEDRRLIELAEAYTSDAQHYLDQGDVFTALACIAYAEGLLDSLRHTGKLQLEWKPLTQLLSRPRVLVAGTFDIIHPGHIHLLREASRHGRVYVIVARDETVKKIKGRPPIVPEQQRLEVVKAIRYVHKALLGSTRNVLEPVLEVKPDIILLGPDQWASEEWLRRELAKHGLNPEIKRLPRKHECPLCSSTAIACKAAKTMKNNCRDPDAEQK